MFGCYSSVFEFGNVTMGYINTFTDWQNMLVSVLHKTGDVYDTIMFIIKTIKTFNDLTTDEQIIEFWYKIAIYFGIAFKLVLDHPPVDFFIKDPVDDFPPANSF